MICPNCKHKDIRSIGVQRYYCKNCCHEIDKKRTEIVLYLLDDKGGRIKVKTIRPSE